MYKLNYAPTTLGVRERKRLNITDPHYGLLPDIYQIFNSWKPYNTEKEFLSRDRSAI